VTGIHLHIGSQITELKPSWPPAKRALTLVKQLRSEGHTVKTLNMGGGLGIVYDHEPAKSPEQYAKALLPLFKGQGLTLLFEPGPLLRRQRWHPGHRGGLRQGNRLE